MGCIGRSSLEIYLIQKIFFCQITAGDISRSDTHTILIIFASVALGILLHEGLERIIGYLYEKTC